MALGFALHWRPFHMRCARCRSGFRPALFASLRQRLLHYLIVVAAALLAGVAIVLALAQGGGEALYLALTMIFSVSLLIVYWPAFLVLRAERAMTAQKPRAWFWSQGMTAPLSIGPYRGTLGSLIFYVIFFSAFLLMAPWMGITALWIYPRSFGVGPCLLGVLLVMIPAIPVAGLILFMDRNRRMHRSMAAVAFIWGAFIATGSSVFVNDFMATCMAGIDGRHMLSAAYVAPIVEETFKGGLLLLYFVLLSDRFDNAFDGLVYGAMIGLGFAISEDYVFFLQSVQSDATVSSGVAVVFLRMMTLLGGHPVYTGLVGFALGYCREKEGWRWRFLIPIAGWIAAVFLHSFWNTMASSLGIPEGSDTQKAIGVLMCLQALLMLTALDAALYLSVVRAAVSRERLVVMHFLVDEIDNGSVTREELEGFKYPWERFKLAVKALLWEDIRRWRLRCDLRREQVCLAMRKWKLFRLEQNPARDPAAASSRERILALRARIAGAPPPARLRIAWRIEGPFSRRQVIAVTACVIVLAPWIIGAWSDAYATIIQEADKRRTAFVLQSAWNESAAGRVGASLSLLADEGDYARASAASRHDWLGRRAELFNMKDQPDSALLCLERRRDLMGDTTLTALDFSPAQFIAAGRMLAEQMTLLDRTDSAVAVIMSTLKFHQEKDSANHASRAALYLSLSRSHLNAGRLRLAEAAADSALAAAVASGGRSCWLASRAYAMQGEILVERGDLDRGIYLLCDGDHGLGNLRNPEIYRLIAEAQRKKNDLPKMLFACERARELSTGTYDIGLAELGLARAYGLLGNVDSAAVHLEAAHDQIALGENHRALLEAQYLLGKARFYALLRQPGEAERFYREAGSAMSRIYSESHPLTLQLRSESREARAR